jgi:glucokinase
MLAGIFHSRPEEITGRSVVRLARDGDPLAKEVIDDFALWLGRGLSAVQEILDPELIVLGGGVSADADLYLPGARAEMEASVVGAGFRPLARVEAASLGSEAGMIGVALLAGQTQLSPSSTGL